MTDKLYLITEAQRDKQYSALENSIDAVTQEITDHKVMWGEDAIPSRVAQRQNLVLKEREHKDAMEMLQSLPMVDSEPVATMTAYGNAGDTYIGWHKLPTPPANTHLYTSPQALTNREIAEKCAEICRSRARSISVDGHNASAANEASKCALAIEHHWQTYPSKSITPSEPLEELLGQYWDIAYKEGQFGEPNGDKANEILHKIRMLFKPLQPITAGDVPDNLALLFCDNLNLPEWPHAKEIIAAAYNAVIKHRGEA